MITLNIKYAEKDIAKECGAVWSFDLKKWTIGEKYKDAFDNAFNYIKKK